MVLEALAAVGLAAAVVQFVQFTTEVASKGQEYYRSADGSIKEHVELQSYSDRFTQLGNGLTTASSRCPPSSTLTTEERSLVEVASKCQTACAEIRSTLNGLIISGKKTKFCSFRQALEAVWSEGKIDTDLHRLQMIRDELIVNLLVVIKYMDQ